MNLCNTNIALYILDNSFFQVDFLFFLSEILMLQLWKIKKQIDMNVQEIYKAVPAAFWEGSGAF